MTPDRALRLMALLTLLCAAIAGCGGGDDDGGASSESLRSSLLPASEFPGYKLHRIYTWEDPIDFTAQGLPVSQNTDPSDVVQLVRDADFSAGSGEELEKPDHSSFVSVAVAKVGSADKAEKLAEQIRAEALKQPCYGTCSERSERFAVSGIPGAEGVAQVPAKTPVGQEPTEAHSTPEPGAPPPFVAYGVGFTIGDTIYMVGVNGEPGSVHKDEAIRAAQALYQRASSSGSSTSGDKDY
jgi:hypothetical protein